MATAVNAAWSPRMDGSSNVFTNAVRGDVNDAAATVSGSARETNAGNGATVAEAAVAA